MKKTIYSLCLFMGLTTSAAFAQVKVGDNPATINASSALEVESATKGFLPPRLDIPNLGAAAPVTSPAEGLIVYNTNTTSGKGLVYWDGSAWRRFQQSAAATNLSVHAAGSVYIGDIAGSPSVGLGVQPGSQNLASITLSSGWAGQGLAHAQWEIAFTNPVPAGKNYWVVLTPRSAVALAAPSNQGDLDNDLITPIILGKTQSSFKLFLQETAGGAQQLYFDIVVMVEN